MKYIEVKLGLSRIFKNLFTPLSLISFASKWFRNWLVELAQTFLLRSQEDWIKYHPMTGYHVRFQTSGVAEFKLALFASSRE
jgi:hypothetical protein